MRDIDVFNKNIHVHISLLFVFRILGMAISFLLVPLLINYLNPVFFGIWVTILSVTAWITVFDIGIGLGLRNKLTESFVRKDRNASKILVSTAYGMIIIISVFILVVILLFSLFGKWSVIFNTDAAFNQELTIVMIILTISTLINFILSLNVQIAYANQKASFSGLKDLLFQIFLFLGILGLLVFSNQGGLLNASIAYFVSVIISNAIFMGYIFYKDPDIFPSSKYFSWDLMKPLMHLGTQFFIIQIAVLLIFSMNNLIITQLLGPEFVTPYNIVFRLFSIIIFIQSIIITPLWSAFTEQYSRNNYSWIKDTLKKMVILMVPITFATLLLAYFGQDIISIWIRQNLVIPELMIALMAIFTLITIWNNIFAYFLNGISKIKLTLVVAIFSAGMNIPLAIYFINYWNLGVSGVILAGIISLSPGIILGPVQTYYILNVKNKHGVLKRILG